MNRKSLLSLLIPFLLTACSQAPSDKSEVPGSEAADTSGSAKITELQQQIVNTNADIAFAVYEDSLLSAKTLLNELEILVEKPSAETLQGAKTACLAAREPYGQSEVYRFRNGPIDVLGHDGTYGEEGNGPEGRINAWPLGEAIIDYVAAEIDGSALPENPANQLQGNLIVDLDALPVINKTTVSEFFEYGEDERNVTTGYHAIEFLLWGQDLNADGSAGAIRDTTAGQRPFTDFLAQEGKCTSGNSNSEVEVCQRRGAYLLAVAGLLIDDLQLVVDAWDPKTGEHYKAFTSDADKSLPKILEAMGRLSFGELAGERINIAVSTDSQEDEHSCFSDNTHRDILLNALGVQNSYLNQYTRISGEKVSGVSFKELLNEMGETALAEKLDEALLNTMTAVSAIDTKAKQGTPFDVLIQEGVNQPDIRATISGLVAQTDVIEQVIQALQLTTGELRQDTEEQLSI